MKPPSDSLRTPRRSEAVDLWLIRLEQVGQWLPAWEDFLSPEEQRKARCIRRPEIAHGTAACRAVLRVLLANKLGIAPQEIAFSYNRFGKPSLNAGVHDARVTFNVSHSGQMALVGIASGTPLGVDIEHTQGRVAIADAASEIFTPAELDRLNCLTEPDRSAELYRFWTLKEAYLKALGVGLSYSPRQIEVLGAVGGGGGAVFIRYSMRVRGGWTTLIVSEVPDYAIAVAYAAPSAVPRLQWFGT